jgi:hypothetical protein
MAWRGLLLRRERDGERAELIRERHEAEEYNGACGEPNLGADGRIYMEVLPFFQRYLVFDKNRQ